MKPYRTVYVKPVFGGTAKKHYLRGWSWETYESGHLLSYDDKVYPSIEEAREAGKRSLKETEIEVSS